MSPIVVIAPFQLGRVVALAVAEFVNGLDSNKIGFTLHCVRQVVIENLEVHTFAEEGMSRITLNNPYVRPDVDLQTSTYFIFRSARL